MLHHQQNEPLSNPDPICGDAASSNGRKSPPLDDPSVTLWLAQQQLELILDRNEDWRALRQLQAREEAGEWFDVIESDVLRARLTRSLAAEPSFMAWQFIDAARGCLAAGMPGEANLQTEIQGLTYSPVTEILAPLIAVPSGGPATSSADPAEAVPLAELVVANPFVPQLDLAPVNAALAARIPTLQRHDNNGVSQRISNIAPYQAALEASDEPTRPTRAIETRAALDVDPADDDAASTQFGREAIGIAEAEVVIISRQPQPSLIEARLPPLPLIDHHVERGGRLPRVERASAVKWVDGSEDATDYRPIGSAMDEAQVAIIDTASKSQAQSRADRRALGIAPDRESQMKRFLGALSGE